MSEYKIDTVQEFSTFLTDFLERFDKTDKRDLEKFLVDELKNSKIFQSIDEIKETISEIFSTVDLADEQFHSLRQSKAKGISSVVWLRDIIGKVIEKFPSAEQSNIIRETKNALKKANSDLFSLLYGMEMPNGLSDPINNYGFKDINATAIIQNLKKELENNTFLGAIAFGEGFGIKGEGFVIVDTEHREIKAVKDYFTTKLDSPEDKQIKKVVIAAAEIAKKNGFGPLVGKSTAEVALIVDRGLTAAKLAYKIGKGEMTSIDVSDYLIDRTASTISTIMIKTCQKVGAEVGKAVGTAIGAVFSPAGAAVGAVVGQTVGYVAGTAVGEVVANGVRKIAIVAKEAVKKVVGKAIDVIKKPIASLLGFS